jgi:hypothetical protein
LGKDHFLSCTLQDFVQAHSGVFRDNLEAQSRLKGGCGQDCPPHKKCRHGELKLAPRRLCRSDIITLSLEV